MTSSPFKYSFVSGSIINTNFDCIQHSDDYKNDPTYIPLNCDDDSIHLETSLIVKDDDDTASVVQENKYIVFHKCIMSLIDMIACSQFNSSSDYVKSTVIGTGLCIKITAFKAIAY